MRKSSTQRFSRQSNDGKTGEVTGWIIIVITLLCAVAGGVGSTFLQPETVDPVTFCGDTITDHTIVLIDQTDQLSNRAILDMRSTLDTIASESKSGTKVSVYRINETSDKLLTPLVSICSPPEFNELKNRKADILKMERTFQRQIMKVMEEAEYVEPSNMSPIFETIAKVLQKTQQKTPDAKRTVYIFSDMLQNSPMLSDYNAPLLERNTVFSNLQLPEARAATLHVYYITRENKKDLQTDQHIINWQELLAKTGATVSIVPVY